MKSLSDKFKKMLPWLAALSGAAITVLAFYPGYMSLDSFDQLMQAKTGIYSGWHPPLMAWIWSLLDKLIPGPLRLLLFFVTMFWAGLALFVRTRIANSYLAAGIILIVGLFPSVFALLGTLWKDVGMGAALVLSAGLISLAAQRKSLVTLALSLPLLFFACCARHEAAFAVLPMLIWTTVVWTRPRRFVPVLAAFAGLAIFLGMKDVVQHSLLAIKPPSSPIQITWVHDLVGLSLSSESPGLPPYLTVHDPEFDFEKSKRIYDPSAALALFKDHGDHKKFPVARTRDEFQSLFNYWMRSVTNQPWQYLKNRWTLFRSSLSIGKRLVFFPFQSGISANPLGITLPESRINQIVMTALSHIRNSWVFRAWIYLALLLLCLGAGIWLRSIDISMIAASALLYEAIHFFTLSACDFRYHWWTVLSVFLCLVILISRLLSRGITREITNVRAIMKWLRYKCVPNGRAVAHGYFRFLHQKSRRSRT